MNFINLRNVDLNLLTIFRAIYEEQGISRAANRLGLTQPAVSHALGRLRHLLDDELFRRTRSSEGSRMEPTPRAHEIAGPLISSLTGIGDILSGNISFDPASVEREIRFGMLDYGMALHAPLITSLLSVEAPGVRMDCRHIQMDTVLEGLEGGQLDVAIGPFENLPSRFIKHPLMQEAFVIVARRDNPNIGRRLTAKTYSNLSHVGLSNLSRLSAMTQQSLHLAGLSREISLTVPHYSAALFAVAKSDLIATVPEGPARVFQEVCGLRILEPPFPTEPLEISMVRHQRCAGDPLMDWLWERMKLEL